MKAVVVEDLPENLAKLVEDFANYLRSLPVVDNKDKSGEPKPRDFLEIDLGVKGPVTRKEIYEDV